MNNCKTINSASSFFILLSFQFVQNVDLAYCTTSRRICEDSEGCSEATETVENAVRSDSRSAGERRTKGSISTKLSQYFFNGTELRKKMELKNSGDEKRRIFQFRVQPRTLPIHC